MALKRRVILERAAWRLRSGETVTDVAFSEGYESVEGFSRAFSRAFGFPPRDAGNAKSHWLSAPNGIHFHPPNALWVTEAERAPVADVTAVMVRHDVDDTGYLLRVAAELGEDDFHRTLMPGHVVLKWDGPEESIAQILDHMLWTKEVWLASIDGENMPPRLGLDHSSLVARHGVVAPRWVQMAESVNPSDTLIDAICDPPESFSLGSVIAHVVTFAAYRRQLVRQLLRRVGVEVNDGDPIMWLREGVE
ncbi:AraC family transcriptional regulator [Hoyosella rhizosphaerae]|uniref:AraC family transcriptional regulator n=1 Tax=Hoyosella rhizosphaerae TaxID=1755582 RepID=A0A916XIX8_9ACTN|nr:AraC family transcriptional regulator [Hoyosella rhizosphaerae]